MLGKYMVSCWRKSGIEGMVQNDNRYSTFYTNDLAEAKANALGRAEEGVYQVDLSRVYSSKPNEVIVRYMKGQLTYDSTDKSCEHSSPFIGSQRSEENGTYYTCNFCGKENCFVGHDETAK